MAEYRTLWQTAWGVVAGLSGATTVGLLIARITHQPPLAAIIVAGVVMIDALYCVFAPVWGWWPFRRAGGEPPLGSRGASIDESVASYDQSGGITARNVTNRPGDEP